MPRNSFLREQCYIAGEWVGPKSGNAPKPDVILVSNPATGEALGEVPNFGRNETQIAIDAAHTAFHDWRRRTPDERSGFCMAMHDALMDNQAVLGELLTLEMGKPLAEAKGEIAFGAGFFKWFAEEARRVGIVRRILTTSLERALQRAEGRFCAKARSRARVAKARAALSHDEAQNK